MSVNIIISNENENKNENENENKKKNCLECLVEHIEVFKFVHMILYYIIEFIQIYFIILSFIILNYISETMLQSTIFGFFGQVNEEKMEITIFYYYSFVVVFLTLFLKIIYICYCVADLMEKLKIINYIIQKVTNSLLSIQLLIANYYVFKPSLSIMLIIFYILLIPIIVNLILGFLIVFLYIKK